MMTKLDSFLIVVFFGLGSHEEKLKKNFEIMLYFPCFWLILLPYKICSISTYFQISRRPSPGVHRNSQQNYSMFTHIEDIALSVCFTKPTRQPGTAGSGGHNLGHARAALGFSDQVPRI